MNVLVIGSGGREHALAWKLRQSPHVTRLFCAPGNPGIGEIAQNVPIAAKDAASLVRFAREESVDLTVVGPEQPLIDGIADAFAREGLRLFGPRKAAAALEGSKAFAKLFMKQHGIPTAESKTFDSAHQFDAERYINEIPVPIVLKADGLAAGKGVFLCETKERALESLDALMRGKVFGEAGSRVVIEDYLVGEEASVLVITDGREFVILPPAQDHKRIFDGDRGKNTGGMGAYAPADIVADDTMEIIKRTIIRPTLAGMQKDGREYSGCLYIGLMITQTGPKVVEYNCRFGDPETQAILPLLDGDLFELLHQAASGSLTTTKLKHNNLDAVCVVVASGGYPDEYETGKEILGIDSASADPDVIIFHAATAMEKHRLVTAGGRVLGVTAWGERNQLETILSRAYRAVQKITFDGAYYRSDIGARALDRLKQAGVP